MARSYPSDISRNQFSKVHLILESTCKKTRPRIVDLHWFRFNFNRIEKYRINDKFQVVDLNPIKLAV
ncbi:hypothetical protein RHOW815_000504 [Candidatus Rhabdochlamydia sp. W815]|nr:hypothetical protein RHOW815_000504 [Candidatus Rhabdochlamydia sp. W815]